MRIFLNPNGGQNGRRLHWLRITLLIVSLLYINLYGAAMLVLKQGADTFLAEKLNVPAGTAKLGAGLNPFGLNIHATQIDYANGLEIGSFRDLVISLPFFAPWQVVTELDSIAYKNEKMDLTTGDIESRVKWTPSKFSYTSKVDDLSIIAAELAGSREPLRVKLLTLDYGLRLGHHDQSQPEEETRLSAAPILLPLAPQPNGEPPVQVDNLEWRLTAEPALPRNMRDRAAVQAWQQAGGQIVVAPLSVDLLGMNLSLTGPLALDQNLLPTGTLKMSLVGIDKAYAQLGTYNERYNLLDSKKYQTLGMLLALAPQAGAGVLEFPISVEGNMFSFIKQPLFQIGTLPWDIVPQTVKQAAPDALKEATPLPAPVPAPMP